MKSILKSRTIWIAVAQAVLGIVVALSIEMEWTGMLLVSKSILDVILRWDTTEPLK